MVAFAKASAVRWAMQHRSDAACGLPHAMQMLIADTIQLSSIWIGAEYESIDGNQGLFGTYPFVSFSSSLSLCFKEALAIPEVLRQVGDSGESRDFVV